MDENLLVFIKKKNFEHFIERVFSRFDLSWEVGGILRQYSYKPYLNFRGSSVCIQNPLSHPLYKEV